ncbi:endoplasmic reticulum-Golgi intermediate compartment protein 2-like isoform X1 [Argonauta hians]
MRRLNIGNKKLTLKVVKELDAFPKIPENYKETSATGGGISILTFIIIFLLTVSEVRYYSQSELEFDYMVDSSVDGSLQLNVDITVAMRCANVGADCLDITGQDVQAFGQLQQEDAYFDLSPQQQRYHNMLQEFNQYLREDYHAIQEVLWLTSGISSLASAMPDPQLKNDKPPDACRIHGSLHVNRVAGNFHITAGKSIPVIPRGHAHLAILVDEQEYNFSHRIDHFSFGKIGSRFLHPLDGEVAITNNNFHIYQYFIQVVPTEVRTYKNNMDTYQFAVTARNRTINHSNGSHGVAGIFVKYDLASLKIRVREEHKPYWQFLVRLCGIIGGIFSVSGMLHGFCGFLVDIICCKFLRPNPNRDRTPFQATQASLHSNPFPPSITPPLTVDAATASNLPLPVTPEASNVTLPSLVQTTLPLMPLKSQDNLQPDV